MMIECPCGESHEAEDVPYFDGPLIFCPQNPASVLYRLDTRSATINGRPAFRGHDGPLWIASA